MLQTSYHRASGVEDALSALRQGSDAKFLAGGQTLLPTMKQRLAAPDTLVDLRHIEALKGIEVHSDHVHVGAGSTHYEVSTHEGLKRAIPALAELAGMIGDMAVRHMGTLGGVIANDDPAADYPSACLALDATIHTDRREIGAAEFFKGMFETALEEDEIVTKVTFRIPEAAAYEKFRNPASRYAMAGVFVARLGGETRVAVTGAGSEGAFRWSEAEAALGGSNGGLDGSVLSDMTPNEGLMLADMHASAPYRAHLVKVMAMRAAARAGSGGGGKAAEDHTQGQIGSVPSGTAGSVRAGGNAGAASESGAPSAQTEMDASERTRHVRTEDSDAATGYPKMPDGTADGGASDGSAMTGGAVSASGTSSGSTSSGGASSGGASDMPSANRDGSVGVAPAGAAARSEQARHVRTHDSGGASAAQAGTQGGAGDPAVSGFSTSGSMSSAPSTAGASSSGSTSSSNASAASESGSPSGAASAEAAERTRHVRTSDSATSSGTPGRPGTPEASGGGLLSRLMRAVGLRS